MWAKIASSALKSLASSTVVKFLGNVGVQYAPDPYSKIGLFLVTAALSSVVTRELEDAMSPKHATQPKIEEVTHTVKPVKALKAK